MAHITHRRQHKARVKARRFSRVRKINGALWISRNSKGATVDEIKREMDRLLEIGINGCCILPEGCTFEILYPRKSGLSEFNESIKRVNREISKSILIKDMV
jgi:phage gp29-like protein